MLCTECYTKNKDDSKFCESCGSSLCAEYTAQLARESKERSDKSQAALTDNDEKN